MANLRTIRCIQMTVLNVVNDKWMVKTKESSHLRLMQVTVNIILITVNNSVLLLNLIYLIKNYLILKWIVNVMFKLAVQIKILAVTVISSKN